MYSVVCCGHYLSVHWEAGAGIQCRERSQQGSRNTKLAEATFEDPVILWQPHLTVHSCGSHWPGGEKISIRVTLVFSLNLRYTYFNNCFMISKVISTTSFRSSQNMQTETTLDTPGGLLVGCNGKHYSKSGLLAWFWIPYWGPRVVLFCFWWHILALLLKPVLEIALFFM